MSAKPGSKHLLFLGGILRNLGMLFLVGGVCGFMTQLVFSTALDFLGISQFDFSFALRFVIAGIILIAAGGYVTGRAKEQQLQAEMPG